MLGSAASSSRIPPIVSPEDVVFGPGTEHDITLLIADYLSSEYPHVSRLVEDAIGPARDDEVRAEAEAVERAILDGDFGEVEGLVSSPGLLGQQTQKAFLYLCWRQQFLEFVDNRESQKAFNLLQKRLKPLEHYQPVPYDFYTLAYLTSASTVHDAPGLRDWAGTGPERERLVAVWRELTDTRRSVEGDAKKHVPPNRLVTLLRQAAAWQVSNVPHGARGPWTVTSLLRDFYTPSVPEYLERLVLGHTANVKCVSFIGDDGSLAVSGSSDTTLRVFSVDSGMTTSVLAGHTSRIWDVAVSEQARYIASASGDGSVRVWSVGGAPLAELDGDGGDVYSVRWRPGHFEQIVTACYDKILRAWDVETHKQIRTFSGHAQSTLSVAFDPTGNVIASGSKDKHVRLWDAVGGVCIQTMTAQLGEITSVEFDNEGKYLLVGCKDNSNRLWDLRMQRNLYRYTGHQNTSKNLIRCAFASPSCNLIASGSEDGLVYLWEREGASSSTSDTQTNSSIITPNATTLNNHPTTPSLVSTSSFASPPTFSPPSPFFSPSLSAQQQSMSQYVNASHQPSRHLGVPRGGGTLAGDRTSPAYYPPRDARPSPTAKNHAATTITPYRALAGHKAGTVFDVRRGKDTLVSAGDDGSVGVWGVAAGNAAGAGDAMDRD